MSHLLIKDKKLYLRLSGLLNEEQTHIINDAFQSYVNEIITGPDNTPDKLELFDSATRAIGLELDLTAENNDPSLFEPGQ